MFIVYSKHFLVFMQWNECFFVTYVFRSEHGILSTCYPAIIVVHFVVKLLNGKR